MKVGKLNISWGAIIPVNKTKGVSHEAVKKKAKKAQKNIRIQTLTRIRVNIRRWLDARQYAESRISPNNTELSRIHRDIEIDAHLWAHGILFGIATKRRQYVFRAISSFGC